MGPNSWILMISATDFLTTALRVVGVGNLQFTNHGERQNQLRTYSLFTLGSTCPKGFEPFEGQETSEHHWAAIWGNSFIYRYCFQPMQLRILSFHQRITVLNLHRMETQKHRGPSCYCWIWKAVVIRPGWRQHGTGASNCCVLVYHRDIMEKMGIVRKIISDWLYDNMYKISFQDLAAWFECHFVGWTHVFPFYHLLLLARTTQFRLGGWVLHVSSIFLISPGQIDETVWNLLSRIGHDIPHHDSSELHHIK